jgi:hypothetical protein
VLMIDRVVIVGAVKVVGISVETVEAEFVQRIEQKEAEARNAQRQSGYVDKGKDLLPGKVSPGDEEEAFEHREGFKSSVRF